MYKPIGLSSLISRRYGCTGDGDEFTIEAAENRNDLFPQCSVLQSPGDDLNAVENALGNTLESDWRASSCLPPLVFMKELGV